MVMIYWGWPTLTIYSNEENFKRTQYATLNKIYETSYEVYVLANKKNTKINLLYRSWPVVFKIVFIPTTLLSEGKDIRNLVDFWFKIKDFTQKKSLSRKKKILIMLIFLLWMLRILYCRYVDWFIGYPLMFNPINSF